MIDRDQLQHTLAHRVAGAVLKDDGKPAEWQECEYCGAPMRDDDGASWPYCVNPSCEDED
jgi:hypothetical protein